MDDSNNLFDFTAYKMRSIIESLAAMGRDDIAHDMQLALDAYMLGEIDIEWRDGWPRLLGSVRTDIG
tara:strand:+ start:1196 stop:1396 length:201 start_codon:yes stop_codon:yes gene_type:complete